jgi:hypothetical protein
MNELAQAEADRAQRERPQPERGTSPQPSRPAVYAFDGWGMIPLAPQAD